MSLNRNSESSLGWNILSIYVIDVIPFSPIGVKTLGHSLPPNTVVVLRSFLLVCHIHCYDRPIGPPGWVVDFISNIGAPEVVTIKYKRTDCFVTKRERECLALFSPRNLQSVLTLDRYCPFLLSVAIKAKWSSQLIWPIVISQFPHAVSSVELSTGVISSMSHGCVDIWQAQGFWHLLPLQRSTYLLKVVLYRQWYLQ